MDDKINQEQNTDNQNQNADINIPEDNNEYEEDPTGENTTFRIVRNVTNEYEVRHKKKIIIGSVICAVLLIIADYIAIPKITFYTSPSPKMLELVDNMFNDSLRVKEIWYNKKSNVGFMNVDLNGKQDYIGIFLDDDTIVSNTAIDIKNTIYQDKIEKSQKAENDEETKKLANTLLNSFNGHYSDFIDIHSDYICNGKKLNTKDGWKLLFDYHKDYKHNHNGVYKNL